MKLLVISHMFPNSFQPWSGIFVRRQLDALRGLGVEILVVSPLPWSISALGAVRPRWRAYAQVARQAPMGGYVVHYPRFLRPPGRWYRRYEALAAALSVCPLVKRLRSQFPFDAVLANMVLCDGSLAVTIGRQWNVPSACYAVDADINLYPAESAALYRQTAQTLSRLDLLLSVGNGFAGRILKVFPSVRRKIHVVPRGVDLELFKPRPRSNSLETHAIRVLFAGRIERDKGVFELVGAFKHLKRTDLKLMIAGEGEDRERVSAEIERSGLRDAITLPGDVTPDQMPQLFADSDVLVLPSHHEGLANVLVEAAACGLPIVASDIDENRDVVRDGQNGLLHPVGSSQGLARCLERLAEDPSLRETMGRKSRQLADEKFDLKRNAKTLYQLLQGAIDQRGNLQRRFA